LFRIDLHVHTKHSTDCLSSVAEAVDAAKAAGLNGIAITDHNTIGGNEEGAKLSTKEFLVIPGIEISSKDGHILGLGVSKLVPRDLSASETVNLIREQGGIAVAAHPFGFGGKIGSVRKAKFDAVEVFNSRAYFLSNGLARRFAERNGLSMAAGSDAHCPDEIGFAGVEVKCKLELETVLNTIKRGEASIYGRPLPILLFLRRALHKFLRRRW
jgi:predicted metal-dependent phosphoesterase TrpH